MVEIVHIQEFTQLNHRSSGKQPRLALERERDGGNLRDAEEPTGGGGDERSCEPRRNLKK